MRICDEYRVLTFLKSIATHDDALHPSSPSHRISTHFLSGIDKAFVVLSRFFTLETTTFFIVIDRIAGQSRGGTVTRLYLESKG
jgi:hypothetical protein